MRIVLEAVVVAYDAGLPAPRTALGGVDLELRTGECVAVVGPTGAGKTSLLEVAAGLLPPTAGRVSLENANAGETLRSSVGLVYQFPEAQFFEETVYDDVAFGPRRQLLNECDVETRVVGALRRAGLSPERFGARAPASLSAGEKRRAAIAGILALERPFLFLDEPTAGLDPATREGVIELILSERSLRGVAVVTHDLELADLVAVRAVVLSDGVVIADGATRDILSDVGFVEEIGLDPPARYVLVEKLRARAPEEAARVERLLFSDRLAKNGPK
jgi:energy-coupling factor transport system ATP-binding protein